MLNKLREEIKSGNFNNIYVLYGDESYLKNLYRNRLLSAMNIDTNNMNYSYYEGKNINFDEVFQKFNLLPFLSDRRVLVVENTALMSASSNRFIEEIKNIPSYLTIIFIETSIDKRKSVYNAIKNIATIVEFVAGNYSESTKMINYIVKSNNKKIDDDALRYILLNSEENILSAINNTEKVISYIDEKENIDIDDVKACVVEKMENKIFDMIRATLEKNDKLAIKRYKELVYYKEAPYKILSIITMEINNMLCVKDLYKKSDMEIAKLLKRPEFAIKKYRELSNKYSGNRLVDILKKCGDLEYEIKSGITQDRLGLERLIMDILYK